MVLARLQTPSWRQGFARYRNRSAYPGLWDGLFGAWLPALGPTGSTLRDVSGRGNHGVLTSMDPATDWVTAGKRGLPMALEFASGQLVDIPDITVTAAQGNSWGFWFKGSSGDQYPLSRIGHSGSYVNVLQTDYVRWRDGLPGDFYGWWTPDILDDKWHFICGTQDKTYTRLYVDGEEMLPAKATVEGSLTWWHAIGEDVAGRMSNTVVYSRVLIPNEVQLLYRDPMALVRRRAMTFPAVTGVTPVQGPYDIKAGLPYVAGSSVGLSYVAGFSAGDAFTAGSAAGVLA